METLFEIATKLVATGVSVIPMRADGSKAPALPSWTEYQQRLPNPPELKNWFDNDNELGIGLVCGTVSGNLGVLDFETTHVYDDWKTLLFRQHGGEELFRKLTVTKTPHGYHVYYRCTEPIGPRKLLARKLNEKAELELLIEYRGEQCLVIAPGSHPNCHPTRLKYFPIQGDLAETTRITNEECRLLVSLAISLNQYLEPERTIHGPTNVFGNRPGDQFNREADWKELLGSHGWSFPYTRDGITYCLRPGKSRGVSATINFANSDLFFNFSGNAHPFEADKAYSKFAAYTFLEHNGDFSKAAHDLRSKGYGKPAFTDIGNSQRLVESFGDQLRWVEQFNKWFFWDGARWRADDLKKVVSFAKETVHNIAQEDNN